MSLQPTVHIEGYDGFDLVDDQNDTSPGAQINRFELVSEEMPFKSGQEGRLVTENFVYIHKERNLGNLITRRRIKDKVHFDQATGKWKVDQLATVSDIKQFPNEWNLFVRNASEDTLGTPILMLFKNDPARAELYKFHKIFSVERLATMTDADCQAFGMGARDDRERARAYKLRVDALAPGVAVDAKLSEKDEQIESLKRQVSSLVEKLESMGEAAVEAKVQGRKKVKFLEGQTNE
jgi:hypothetical protein